MGWIPERFAEAPAASAIRIGPRAETATATGLRGCERISSGPWLPMKTLSHSGSRGIPMALALGCANAPVPQPETAAGGFALVHHHASTLAAAARAAAGRAAARPAPPSARARRRTRWTAPSTTTVLAALRRPPTTARSRATTAAVAGSAPAVRARRGVGAPRLSGARRRGPTAPLLERGEERYRRADHQSRAAPLRERDMQVC